MAIRAADTAKGIGCIRCGFCMYGCPYGCIYNSADTVRELRAEKNFTYQRDVIVTTLREDSGKVIIEGRHRRTREPLSFEAEPRLSGGRRDSDRADFIAFAIRL